MSRSNIGLNAVYNGGLTAGYMPVQGGAGFMDWLKKANEMAKKYQVVSKLGAIADATGARDIINQKTGGYFDKAVSEGQKRGYGKRKRGRGKKRGSGVKRKSKPMY